MREIQSAKSADLPPSLSSLLPHGKLMAPLSAALRHVLMLDRLNGIYHEALDLEDGRPFFERLLSVLNVQPELGDADLDHIPRSGSVVAVANHPFGFIEGVLLAALLPKIRPDVKIMANSLLSAFPAINDSFIYVNPFG